jgi:hypothetical protein
MCEGKAQMGEEMLGLHFLEADLTTVRAGRMLLPTEFLVTHLCYLLSEPQGY